MAPHPGLGSWAPGAEPTCGGGWRAAPILCSGLPGGRASASSCSIILLLCPLGPGPLTCALSPTDVPVEKLAAMPALRSINLRFNPLSAEVRVIAPPLITFDMLMSPEGARAPPP